MRKKKKKDKVEGYFVPITYDMIDSNAFKEMNGSALKAYILCLRKVKTHNPFDRYNYQFSAIYYF